MSNKVEQLLNRVQPVRRDFLKGLIVTGALANIALPASTVLVPTEASAQSKTGQKAPTEASKAPASAPTGGSCTPSAVPVCNPQDPAAFDVCEHGKIVTRKCAPGTKCDKGFCVAGGGASSAGGAPPAAGDAKKPDEKKPAGKKPDEKKP